MDKTIELDDVNNLLNDINKRSLCHGVEYELSIREVGNEKAASLFYKSNSNTVMLPVYTRKLNRISLNEVYCILIGLDNAIQES